jgi:hypothetical protein
LYEIAYEFVLGRLHASVPSEFLYILMANAVEMSPDVLQEIVFVSEASIVTPFNDIPYGFWIATFSPHFLKKNKRIFLIEYPL